MPDLSYPLTIISLLLGMPLAAFAGLLFGGARIQEKAGRYALILTAAGLLLSLTTLWRTADESVSFSWVAVKGFEQAIAFRLDILTAVMLPLVHFIALLVQYYSTAYMKGDRALYRYFAFLQLFLFSMLGIILAGNLIVMYIFWELVGISSYLLISFWHDRPRAVWAAQKAFILNRIGDAAFLCGILLLIYHTGTTDLQMLPQAVGSLSQGTLTLIGLLLFGGCMGKSAQFPLSAWLPDAMEGPTPVSALIHAATMVAAGIFLLARIAFLITPAAGNVIAIIGLITMVDGAVRACVAWDIKKVLAYSTQSQLGLMVFAVGTGAWQLAMFHLVTHAFFKAGLFLSAGSVIHAMTPAESGSKIDPQDMRTMGGLAWMLPVTFICYTLCAAALSGLPFFSGFLSKDAIFAHAFEWAGTQGQASLGLIAHVGVSLAVSSAALTAYYMARQVWLIFAGIPRYVAYRGVHPHESPRAMWVPMAILSVLSLFFFFALNPFNGTGGWLAGLLGYPGEIHSWMVPALSVLATLGGLWAARKRIASEEGFRDVRIPGEGIFSKGLFRNYSEQQHHHVFFIPVFQRTGAVFKWVEIKLVDAVVNLTGYLTIVFAHITGRVDRFAVDGLVRLTSGAAGFAGNIVRSLQNGKIQTYFLVTFIGLIALFMWLIAGA